jgi:hypothetical protein
MREELDFILFLAAAILAPLYVLAHFPAIWIF